MRIAVIHHERETLRARLAPGIESFRPEGVGA
jgi:hypothetical protein